MLCLADRGFYSFERFKKRADRGAAALAGEPNMLLPREQQLSDGSSLTRIYANQTDQRAQRDGLHVRVVDTLSMTPRSATLSSATGCSARSFSPSKHQPVDLAALYHER